MKKKILQIVWLMIVIAIPLYQFANKQYEKHKKDELICAASEAVSEYINDKYGFEVEGIEFSDDKYGSFFWDEMTQLEFMITYGGRDFYALFIKTGDKITCYDDYQYEEIYAVAEKSISQHFPKGQIIDMRFHCSDSGYYCLMDGDTYFDGNDIDGFLKKCDGYIEMVFYDSMFSEAEISELISTENLDIEFTSFDTMEHRDEFMNNISSSDHVLFLYFYENLEKYAPHITDYLKIQNGEVTDFDITILENDEFEYAYFPVEPRKLVTRNSIQTECVENKSMLMKIYTNHGEEKWLSKPLSDEYYFDSIYGDVWIYYPMERLEGYDINSVGLAWFSAGGMSNNRDISKAEICGDYAVFNMPFGEDYFMLVDNSGQEEYIPDYGN